MCVCGVCVCCGVEWVDMRIVSGLCYVCSCVCVMVCVCVCVCVWCIVDVAVDVDGVVGRTLCM